MEGVTGVASAPTRRQRIRRCGLVAGSLLVSGVLAELVVRAWFGAPLAERLPVLEIQANAKRGWMMVPSQAHYTYLHRVEVNALGLRGAEVGEKRATDMRVLCLGDSLTYGQGVADDETLPAHLETILNARTRPGVRWATINAGHRAYSTHQELALLEELGARIEPDVVVVFWYWNDIEEQDIEGTYARLQRSGPVAFDTGAPMEGWVWWRWQAKQLVRRSALAMVLHDAFRGPYMGNEPTDEALAGAMRRQAAYLQRFIALSVERRFLLVVAIIPDWNAVGVADHWTKDVGARFAALAVDSGVAVIDLEDAVAAAARELGRAPTVPFDGHYGPLANRRMAAAVAGHLLR